MKPGIDKMIAHYRAWLEVGGRIRQLRELLSLSQEEFAEQIAPITRDQVANWELGRTPLTVERAFSLCETFIVSEKWLATGEGIIRQFMDLSHDPEAQKTPLHAAFYRAYPVFLKARYEALAADNPSGIRFTASGDRPPMDLNLINFYLAIWTSWIGPGVSSPGLIEALISAGTEYCASNACVNMSEPEVLALLSERGLPVGDARFLECHRKLKGSSFRGRDSECKQVLTKETSSNTSAGVTPIPIETWKQLRTAVKARTSTRGAKAQLAKDLKVSRQVVTAWLRKDGAAPSADFCLRLLAWVTAREAKQ